MWKSNKAPKINKKIMINNRDLNTDQKDHDLSCHHFGHNHSVLVLCYKQTKSISRKSQVYRGKDQRHIWKCVFTSIHQRAAGQNKAVLHTLTCRKVKHLQCDITQLSSSASQNCPEFYFQRSQTKNKTKVSFSFYHKYGVTTLSNSGHLLDPLWSALGTS